MSKEQFLAQYGRFKPENIGTVKAFDMINEDFKSWFGKSVLHTDGKPHTFYHGTGHDIEKFDHKYIDSGNDAYGSGFYFTNKPDVASDYATKDKYKSGNVIPVHIRLENPIHTNSGKSLSRNHIEKLIRSAPEHEESLSNFGDIKYEGYHKVLKSAVDQYTSDSKFHSMNKLHNDFYSGHPDKFLKNFTKITGHDGVIHTEGDHIIINTFHPEQIKSAIGSGYSRNSDKLVESMDSTLNKTKVPEDSMLHQMGAFSASMIGGDNFSMHKLSGAGYMIQFDKEGATELHHVDDDLKGGYIKNNQPSIKLISTYRKHIKDLVDSGKKVRIVAHNAVADSFHRITKHIADRTPGYKVSEPESTVHPITDDKLKSWEITK